MTPPVETGRAMLDAWIAGYEACGDEAKAARALGVDALDAGRARMVFKGGMARMLNDLQDWAPIRAER